MGTYGGDHRTHFIFFAMIGIMTMQFSYFAAVKASNAATATVIQYIYPVVILICTSVYKKKKPKMYEVIAVLSAFAGVFVVATHCNLNQLNMSPTAVFWGLESDKFTIYFHGAQEGRKVDYPIIDESTLCDAGCFFFGLVDKNFGLRYNFFGFGGQNYGL